jgi:glyoxalase family protein
MLLLQGNPMNGRILGLHHVTAIAGDPQRNVEFYMNALGLNLVKQTVNFDDPQTYHLYYGDETGRPGTLLTFFPWPGAPQGRRGAGQATTVSFAVHESDFDYWRRRLSENRITFISTTKFDNDVIRFRDPDDLNLELVPVSGAHSGLSNGILGLFGVTITETRDVTGFLERNLGFRRIAREGSRTRLEIGRGGFGTYLDIELTQGLPGKVMVGTVHHVAWRVSDDTDQEAFRDRLTPSLSVTPIIDRRYFRSIYFREPGGALFEIATDPPGFLIDEDANALGRKLVLPEWLEPDRNTIEAQLPKLILPELRAA